MAEKGNELGEEKFSLENCLLGNLKFFKHVFIFLPNAMQHAEFYSSPQTEEELLEQMALAQMTFFTEAVAPSLHQQQLNIFQYLFACYSNCDTYVKVALRMTKEVQELQDLGKKTMIKCARVYLQSPELFERAFFKPAHMLILSTLLDEPHSHLFVHHVVEEWVAHDMAEGRRVLSQVLAALPSAAKPHMLLDRVARVAQALLTIAALPLACELLTSLESWNPVTLYPSEFEMKHVLGCVLSVSPFSEIVIATDAYFPSFPKLSLDDPGVERSIGSMRAAVGLLHNSCEALFRGLLSNQHLRSKVLEFFSVVVRINKKRTQTHREKSAVSSDGFVYNILATMLRLCAPFTTIDPKFDKIDPNYYLTANTFVDIVGETRLGESLPPLEGQGQTPSFSFVNDIFYLTLSMLHYSVVPILATTRVELGDPRYSRIAQMQEITRGGTVNPALTQGLHTAVRVLHATFTAIFEPGFISSLLSFVRFTCSWLLHLADPLDKGLPLHETIPQSFALLPEFIFDDIVEILLFISSTKPVLLEESSYLRPIIQFLVTFIGSRHYLRNPYLKSRMVEILFMYTKEVRGGIETRVFSVLHNDALAINTFAPSLMSFFVEMEDTDPYSMYGKRYHMAVILKNLWISPFHQRALLACSDTPEFTRFAMLLINDTTYLLDEARDRLNKIHALNLTIASPEFNTFPPDRQQELAGQLADHKARVKAYVQLGGETVQLFLILTKLIVAPFLRVEIVGRLAGMLAYNMVALISPDKLTASMEECKAHKFNPSNLLHDICLIALQVSGLMFGDASLINNSFIEAMARDERSYNYETFTNILYVLEGARYSSSIAADFHKLIDAVEVKAVEERTSAVDFGDIPEEYSDPIMAHLMTDPVILPSSRVVVDRSTIVTHLLSQPIDPFNRSPLKIEEVIPATDLKAEIEEWKASKLKKN